MELLVTSKQPGVLPWEVKKNSTPFVLFDSIKISHLVNRWLIVVNRWLTGWTFRCATGEMYLRVDLAL